MDPANKTAARYVLFGGLCAGLADFIYPTTRALLGGKDWTTPWTGVASGLLGGAAQGGGIGIALLGVALHFFICLSGAALLYLLVSRVRFLPRYWLVLGVLYGIAVLLTMNYVILPLSAIGRSIYPLDKLHVH